MAQDCYFNKIDYIKSTWMYPDSVAANHIPNYYRLLIQQNYATRDNRSLSQSKIDRDSPLMEQDHGL